MCIRVRFAPRAEIHDPWDRAQNTIILPDLLAAAIHYAIAAVRAVLEEMGVVQGEFGARCWCGEYLNLPAVISEQQNEVSHLGA